MVNKKLRMHQEDLLKRSFEIVSSKVTSKFTTAAITAGGGKTLAAALFSKTLLDAKKISRVCWVTPRTSLTSQAASSFRDKDFNPNYSARECNNILPFFREIDKGQISYITTYQAISAAPLKHLNELSKQPYLLILDEPHHLSLDNTKEDSLWYKSVEPLVSNAFHTLLISGTLTRHDKSLIPFITYEEDSDGRKFPIKDIIYSRYDGLIESAIVPIKFHFISGWASYEDSEGKHRVESSLATDSEVSKVIQTLLMKSSYRDSVLKQGLDEWILSRNQYKSRAIVICATQDMAESVSEQIKTMYKGVQVALAISREGAESQETIKKFRKNEYGHVLVTVGMAYEGLDVPDCKTLICLTDTRSIPWLEQAFARVTRVDYKAVAAGITYEQQRASIYVPDDPKMRAIVDYFEDEQDRGLKAKKEKEAQLEEEEKEKGDRKAPGASFTSLGAESIGTTTSVLGLSLDDTVTLLPEAEDEKDVRRKIEMYARRRDVIKRLPRGSTNKLVYSQFGKPRNKMGLTELNKVLNYLISLTR